MGQDCTIKPDDSDNCRLLQSTIKGAWCLQMIIVKVTGLIARPVPPPSPPMDATFMRSLESERGAEAIALRSILHTLVTRSDPTGHTHWRFTRMA